MSESGPTVELLANFLDAINRHDPEVIIRYFTRDCIFESVRGPYPYGQRFRGASAVAEAFRAMFSRFPDMSLSEIKHFVSGPRAATEWRLRGTRHSGERVDAYGCYIYDFEGRLISHLSSYRKMIR